MMWCAFGLKMEEKKYVFGQRTFVLEYIGTVLF
jgi:hypothetical protein